MRKHLLFLFIIALSFVGASNALAQRGTRYTPVEIDTVRFPIMKVGALTPKRQAELGLHADTLSSDEAYFNYYRNGDHFVAEVLKKGTTLYFDRDNVARYKADCTNVVAKISECPKCREMIAALRADSIANAEARVSVTAKARTETESSVTKFLKSFWNMIGTILKWILAAVLVLLGLAIVGLLVSLLFLLIGWVIRELLRLFERSARPVAPITPAPVPVVLAPVPAPVVVTVTPAPVAPTPVVAPLVPAPVPALTSAATPRTEVATTVAPDGGTRIIVSVWR